MQEMDDVLSDREYRKGYFVYDFLTFYTFYSKNEITWWQRLWCIALEGREDIMFLAFRGSAKTTIVRWYVVWCIIYNIEPYIIVQSYEDSLSGAWVREVAKMLMFENIVADFGLLFPFDLGRENMAKSSMSSFESTNGVKVEAKSLGKTVRGANTTTKDGESTRPTLVIMDDIDVEKSVRSCDTIDANEKKILGETFGALDPVRRRIIFLGNVINEDGIVPRFKKRYSDSWKVFEQWLFDSDGECVWPEQFTEEVVEKLKGDGERSFAQNYLGVPFTNKDSIIKRTSIQYADTPPEGCTVSIGIDPAFSEKTGTDGMGFACTFHKGIYKYIHTMVGFEGIEKNEVRFTAYVEEVYKKHKVSRVYIESNNGGEIIARMLKAKGIAVEIMHAERDKVTRLMEYEGCFERREVYFLPGTEKGVEQLLAFPNGDKDDMVDAMVYSFKKGSGVIFGRG